MFLEEVGSRGAWKVEAAAIYIYIIFFFSGKSTRDLNKFQMFGTLFSSI